MADILRWHTVKTRKPHYCFGCALEYEPGTNMINAAYADGGTVDSCYWCETCTEYMYRYFGLGDETGYGEIRSNDKETWESIRHELEVI